MDENRESIILGVELDAGKVATELADISRQIANVKKEQKQLDDEYKSGKISLAEYTQSTAAMKDELTWLQKQQKGNIATQKLLTETTDTYADSLNGERQKLADMLKAYDQLDKATRESEGGKAFLAQIQKQTQAVSDMEKATGRAQRSVGNYPTILQRIVEPLQMIEGLGEKVKGTTSGLAGMAQSASAAFKGLGSSLKVATVEMLKFLATPIGAVLTAVGVVLGAIVVAFGKLSEAFKKNYEAGTNWARLMASLQPIIDAIGRAFDKLATAIGKVAGKLASWIGSNSEAVKSAQDLVTAMGDLQESERKYTEDSAKRNKEVSELRAKAAEKDKYSAMERQKYLADAMELEKQNLEEQKKIKAEQLRILEETAKKNSDTSDATKDKIAAARAAMYQAEQAYYDGTRRLQKEYQSATNEIAAERQKQFDEETKKAQEAAQKLSDIRATLLERTRSALDNEIAALEEEKAKELEVEGLTAEEKIQIEQYYYDRINELREADKQAQEQAELAKLQARQAAREEFGLDPEKTPEEQELERLNEAHEQQLLNDEEYEQARTAIQERFAKQRSDNEKKEADALREQFRANLKAATLAASDASAAMADALSEFAANSEAAATAQKAFGMISILTNQAQAIAAGARAIAEGTASAAAIPFPGNIPAIISIVAQITALIAGVMSSITQAKQLMSQANTQKFHGGGIVEGTSYSGDHTPVMADAGEMYLNRATQRDLFNFLTGKESAIQAGYGTEAMTQTMTAAVAAMPAPVLVLKEFEEFNDKVTTFNEIASV